MISWIWIGLILITVVGVVMLIIGLIDGNRYVVKEEHFVLPKLEKACRFVMLSDLHGKVYGENNNKLIEDIRRAKPDFIVIVGDLVTSKQKAEIATGVNLIKELSREFRVYYAMGNHETKMKERREQFGNRYEELLSAVENSNVTILADAACDIPEYNIRITGLELGWKFFARLQKMTLTQEVLEQHIDSAQRNMCNILLAHNPNYFEEYAKWGADLVLSGHVHGGIMRLPIVGGVISPSLELFPKYDGGVFRHAGSVMLLGRGMGAHTIPLRFFNPAELYVITLDMR